jgi:hypothetical protein
VNHARIRGFLLQQPKPASVRVTVNGEVEQIAINRSMSKVAESIEALGCELIECLDKDGKLLRAVRVSSADAHRSDAAPIPTGIETDPQALMLTHFANLLHRAYEHSTEIAFSKMVELVERIGDRSESIEARLERSEAAQRRLVNEQIEDAFERAEETAAKPAESDLLSQMASAFMGGQQQHAAAPKNGKGQA